jgi:nucleoside-diphosphate-sugar epimerase
VDESLPYPDRFECAYARTKARAEKMVLEAHGQKGLCTISLRPHLIYGPGDPHLIPRVLQRAREGRLFQVGDGTNRVDLTFVDNAAQAHILAGDRIQTAGGRAYFLSDGEPVTLWPWIAGVLEEVGIPPVRRSLSFGMARALGLLMEGLYTLLRLPGEPRMTRFVASQLATSHWFDISASRRELGYEPQVSGAEGTRRLIEWIRAGGLDGA